MKDNILCSILAQRNNQGNYVLCVITKHNGDSDLFFQHISFIAGKGFITRRDINIYYNAPIHVRGRCKYLSNMLETIGIDAILLPKYLPELNPAELVFSDLVWKMQAFFRINLDQFTTDDIKNVCKKCSYVNLSN